MKANGRLDLYNGMIVQSNDGTHTVDITNAGGGYGAQTALKVHYAAATSDRYAAKFSSGW